MNTLTDQQLLRNYTGNRSEESFSELVRRHVDLVYFAALRMVRDAHLAQDVTQGVFVALAQNAGSLADRPVLSGWLHRTAQNLSANAVRSEVRRRVRETEAATMNESFTPEADPLWEHIAPHLDAALGELSEADRDALLLRYFERKSARAMAETLGTSEDAAQKRVGRAIERLRECFEKRGVTVGASALGVIISANAVQAAPIGLAVIVSTFTALAVTAPATIATATITKAIVMTTLQKTLITALVVASIATPLVLYKNSKARQLEANSSLQRQSDVLAKQQADKTRLSALASQAGNPDTLPKELHGLRAEAGSLRKQSNTLTGVKAQNSRLKAAANMPDVEPSDLEKEQVAGKMADSKNWAMASFLYSRKNKGQFPPSIDKASSFFPDKTKLATNSMADQYEIVYHGSLEKLAQPENVIVVRQKGPTSYGNRWASVYAYGDGHVEMHVQAESDFESWEKQHLPATP